MWRWLAIFCVAVAAHSQSVSGTLTDSITHAPIPSVIVTLLGHDRYNSTTDEAGVFHFPEVHPGRYFLNIDKAGYVLPQAQSGAFRVDRDMRLNVEMDPLGRVEGRVRFPDGRPAPRATLALTGEGHNYTGEADPGGHFLIEDVVPGSYILRATGTVLDPKFEGEIWAPTYFPSTTDRNGAEAIPVVNGLTVTREVRLRSVPARSVSGVVRDETGELAAGVTVRVENQTVVTAGDGRFEFVTRDGEWRLTATRKDGDLERRGVTTVFVARHDVENVEVRLALPFPVRLLVEGDKEDATPGRPPRMLMALLSPVNGLPQFIHGEPDRDSQVYPGRYTIQIVGGVSGSSYVESIKLGELEVYGRTFDLWDGSQPIRVTFRLGGAWIRGNVESAVAATVVVVDADESVATSRSRTYPTSGTRFDVGPLRPGDYYVFAVDRPNLPGLTEGMIRSMLARAEKVHVGKNDVSTLMLKVIPLP